jgi:hypothetical protein
MTRSVRFRVPRLLPVLVALVAFDAACGNRIVPLGPSGDPATAAIAVESFVGVLPVGSSRFYSFTVPQDGRVSLTLLSLTQNGEASSALVNLAIGVPRAADCVVVESRTIGADVKPALSDAYPAGVYCTRVSDVGNLTSNAAFAVNITRPE